LGLKGGAQLPLTSSDEQKSAPFARTTFACALVRPPPMDVDPVQVPSPPPSSSFQRNDSGESVLMEVDVDVPQQQQQQKLRLPVPLDTSPGHQIQAWVRFVMLQKDPKPAWKRTVDQGLVFLTQNLMLDYELTCAHGRALLLDLYPKTVHASCLRWGKDDVVWIKNEKGEHVRVESEIDDSGNVIDAWRRVLSFIEPHEEETETRLTTLSARCLRVLTDALETYRDHAAYCEALMTRMPWTDEELVYPNAAAFATPPVHLVPCTQPGQQHKVVFIRDTKVYFGTWRCEAPPVSSTFRDVYECLLPASCFKNKRLRCVPLLWTRVVSNADGTGFVGPKWVATHRACVTSVHAAISQAVHTSARGWGFAFAI